MHVMCFDSFQAKRFDLVQFIFCVFCVWQIVWLFAVTRSTIRISSSNRTISRIPNNEFESTARIDGRKRRKTDPIKTIQITNFRSCKFLNYSYSIISQLFQLRGARTTFFPILHFSSTATLLKCFVGSPWFSGVAIVSFIARLATSVDVHYTGVAADGAQHSKKSPWHFKSTKIERKKVLARANKV